MLHQITAVVAKSASEVGALDGFDAVCTCGAHIGSSLEGLARQWGREHADYMNRKASK